MYYSGINIKSHWNILTHYVIQTLLQMAHFHSWHKQIQSSAQVQLKMWAKQTSLCFYMSFSTLKQEHHLKPDPEQLQELKQPLMRKKTENIQINSVTPTNNWKTSKTNSKLVLTYESTHDLDTWINDFIEINKINVLNITLTYSLLSYIAIQPGSVPINFI